MVEYEGAELGLEHRGDHYRVVSYKDTSFGGTAATLENGRLQSYWSRMKVPLNFLERKFGDGSYRDDHSEVA
jgi:hypothetical protein